MTKVEKIKANIKTHKKEVKRLNDLLKREDLIDSTRKAVVTQIKHSEKAISRLTGRLEKQGVVVTQKKAVPTVKKATKKVKKAKTVSKSKK